MYIGEAHAVEKTSGNREATMRKRMMFVSEDQPGLNLSWTWVRNHCPLGNDGY